MGRNVARSRTLRNYTIYHNHSPAHTQDPGHRHFYNKWQYVNENVYMGAKRGQCWVLYLAHLEPKCPKPRTQQRWRSPSAQWCSQSGMPDLRWKLSEGQSWGLTPRNTPNRSSSQWAGRRRRELSRRRWGNAWRNRNMMGASPLRILLRRHPHLEKVKEQSENLAFACLKYT